MNVFTTILDVIVRSDKATPRLREVKEHFDNLEASSRALRGSFVNLAGAFTALVVARKVVDAIRGLITPAKQLQFAFQKLQTLTGATTDELKAYKNVALEAAAITPYGPAEAASVMLQLRQATGSTDAALRTLLPTLQLAMASFGKLTPEKTAGMMSEMVRAFGMTGDQATRAADQIYGMAKVGGMQIQNLSNVMGKLAMAAHHGGQSFDEMLQAMILARRVMPSSERAATRLMRLMGELATPKVQEALGEIGVATVDMTGRIRNLSEVMLELATKGQVELRDALQKAFGQAAVKPVIAMISQLTGNFRDQNGQVLRGAEVYKYLGDAGLESIGQLQKASEDYLNTWEGISQVVSESWEKLRASLGAYLLPMLQAIGTALKSILGLFQGIADTPIVGWLIGGGTRLLAIVGAVWAFKAAIYGAGRILSVTIGNLNTFTSAIGATMAKFGGLRGVLGRFKSDMKGLSKTWREQTVFAKAAGMRVGFFSTQAIRFTKIAPALSGALITAARGFKALMGAVGGPIGILLMFLPEIIEYGKKLYDWATQADKRERLIKEIHKWVAEETKQINAWRDKALAAARKASHWMTMSAKSYDKLLDRLEGLTKWKPAVIDVNAIMAAEKAIKRMVTAGPPELREQAKALQANIDSVRSTMIQEMGKKGAFGSVATATIQGALATVANTLNAWASAGLVAPAVAERFSEKAAQPAVALTAAKGAKEGSAQYLRTAKGKLPKASGGGEIPIPGGMGAPDIPMPMGGMLGLKVTSDWLVRQHAMLQELARQTEAQEKIEKNTKDMHKAQLMDLDEKRKVMVEIAKEMGRYNLPGLGALSAGDVWNHIRAVLGAGRVIPSNP